MEDRAKILHVEDNPDNRLLVRRVLQAAGYIVLEASDAHEALDMLRLQTPDLILMDINLPEIDGYTLTRQLKVSPATKDVPIIVVHQISGHLSTLNSKALDVVGDTAATKDPAGGVIRRRDCSREPNGVLEEVAQYNAVYKLLPAVGPEGVKTFAREGPKLWARFGYTTAQEGRSTPGSAALLEQVAAEGGHPREVIMFMKG